MRLDYLCALDGAQLTDVDERIYVEDIREEVTLNTETGKRPGWGLIPLHDPARDSLDIRVTFHIKERDLTQRMDVLQKVAAWAGKGWFTRNHRPDRRIYVYCTKPAAVQTAGRTERFEIGFTAYGEACWESALPQTVSAETEEDELELRTTGTRPCFLEAEITPVSAALTSATLTAGDQSIALSGLNVPAGTALRLWYDELHCLRIESGGVSCADKRTAASADHIVLQPGTTCTVSVAFNTECSCVLKARGLWL